jgi:hypothetical protein
MSKQSELLMSTPERILIETNLGNIDLPALLTICVDLLTICARRSVEIDTAVAAMVAYARDEVLERLSNDRSLGASASATQITNGRIKRTRN